MTFEKLLKSMRPSFWSLSTRGPGLRLKYLQRYLDEGGDVHARGPNGWTLLHYAAENVEPQAIRLLVSRAADINAQDDVGYTPLHLAVDADCDTSSRDCRRAVELPTARALIEGGADESIRDNKGTIPRDTAIAYGRIETALYDAISRTHRAKCNVTDIPPHLLSTLSPEEIDPLLDEWRWLIGDDRRSLFLTAAGDIFLMDTHGRVLWLNTGHGTVIPLANSLSEFESFLADKQNIDDWCFAPAVQRLRESGKQLTSGECYGFVMLPILGGGWEGDNRVPVSAKEHLGLTGHLHHKLKDLPDGANVRLRFTD